MEIQLVSGQRVSLKEASKGKKAVLVNFWFAGCGPCHAEAPHLQALYAALKDKGLEVVSIDLGGGKEAVEEFVRKHGLTFPVALGGNAERGKDTVFSRYGRLAPDGLQRRPDRGVARRAGEAGGEVSRQGASVALLVP